MRPVTRRARRAQLEVGEMRRYNESTGAGATAGTQSPQSRVFLAFCARFFYFLLSGHPVRRGAGGIPGGAETEQRYRWGGGEAVGGAPRRRVCSGRKFEHHGRRVS